MTWLAGRQFRGQALIGLAVLVVFSGYLLIAGYVIRHSYNTDVLGCLAADGCDRSDAEKHFAESHAALVIIPSILLLVLPGIIGLFWGAPLVAREYEAGTQRLAWTQSVTRRRWLVLKLAVAAVAAVVVTGLLSLLMTWAASRFDQVLGLRFNPLLFGSRNVVPVGYAVFALVVGTLVGLFLRRTVPAMALTLLIVAIVLFAVPLGVRPYLWAPVTDSIAYNEKVRDSLVGGLSIRRGAPIVIDGYTVPGALMLSSRSELMDASGKPVYPTDVQDCLSQLSMDVASDNGPDRLERCLMNHNLHFMVKYQPGHRYWSFQWFELGGYLVLSVLLAAVANWRIRRLRA
jgi:ABC-type transport system involved in multi-copper enzyme maturation permease subunit